MDKRFSDREFEQDTDPAEEHDINGADSGGRLGVPDNEGSGLRFDNLGVDGLVQGLLCISKLLDVGIDAYRRAAAANDRDSLLSDVGFREPDSNERVPPPDCWARRQRNIYAADDQCPGPLFSHEGWESRHNGNIVLDD
jgi:hypothetical protein